MQKLTWTDVFEKLRSGAEDGPESVIPGWASSLVRLGWTVAEDRFEDRRSLIIIVVPSRRIAPSLVTLGMTIHAASRETGYWRFAEGETVRWIEGGRLKKGVFYGADPDQYNLIKIVETQRNGQASTYWKSDAEIFPDTPGLQAMIADLEKVKLFRETCPNVAVPRRTGQPTVRLYTTVGNTLSDAESLYFFIEQQKASLRQLLLWRQDGGIGFSGLSTIADDTDYSPMSLAVLDGSDAFRHLDRDELGDRLNDGRKSIVGLIQEDEFVRSESWIEAILSDWCGEPIGDQVHFAKFRELYKTLPGAEVIHHSASIEGSGHA